MAIIPPIGGPNFAILISIYQGENKMAIKVCQCGSRYFCVDKVEEKKIVVKCIVCGSSYGCLIPVFPIGYYARWAVVNQN